MNLKQTLPRHYDAMLEVLPPAAHKQIGHYWGFLVGEPMRHNEQGEEMYTSYFANREDGLYYVGDVMTVTEFEKITEDDINDATSDAEPVNEKVEQELELIEEYGEDVVQAYQNCFSADDLDGLEEAYIGQYDSDEDFAQNVAEELVDIDREMRWPHNCIDWEHAARELMYDYCEDNGHYFHNY